MHIRITTARLGRRVMDAKSELFALICSLGSVASEAKENAKDRDLWMKWYNEKVERIEKLNDEVDGMQVYIDILVERMEEAGLPIPHKSR